MADWSALPGIALVLIARRLEFIEDFIAFRSTCSSWLLATPLMDFYTTSSCPKLPLLILLKSVKGDNFKFLGLSSNNGTRKICDFSLPQLNGKKYLASKGWLFMVDYRTHNSCLFHPISRLQIPLPQIPNQITDSEGFIIQPDYLRSVSLSASPSETSDYVVTVAFLEERHTSTDRQSRTYTGFWKPGNLTWTKVDIPGFVDDLNYYNGKFYALANHYTQVWMCDVSKPNPTASLIVELPWKMSSRREAQLVECGGRLLIVAPFFSIHYDLGNQDNLEMVEIDVIKRTYTTITSLGNSAVFLGMNEGFSIDANRFPGIIESNSIYFGGNGYHRVATPGPDTKNPMYIPGNRRVFNFNYISRTTNGIWLNF